MSVAGAVSINIVTTTSQADLADAAAISAGGALTLRSSANTDVKAIAKGDTAADASVGVGAGVAINKVDIVNRATTRNASVSSAGLTVEATMSTGRGNDAIRYWDAGAGAWVLIEQGDELPGPSEGDIFYKTADNKFYKYASGSWSVDATCNAAAGSGNDFPGSPSSGDCFKLTKANDGHPANAYYRYDGSNWVFKTLDAGDDTPKDEIKENARFQLLKQDGSNAPGVYKRNGSHAWVLDAGAVTSGVDLPSAPVDGQLFRLEEHEIYARGVAGASKASDVGIAGAFGMNIVTTTTEAVVTSSTVDAHAGDIVVNAIGNEYDYARASGKADVGSATGVGAAFALNVLIGNVTRAEIEAGTPVTGGDDVTVTATARRQITTSVEAGTAGGTAITPAVALVVLKGEDSTARIGASGTAVSATGAVRISARHTAAIETEGSAEAASDDVAVGADVAINVVLEWRTTARARAEPHRRLGRGLGRSR